MNQAEALEIVDRAFDGLSSCGHYDLSEPLEAIRLRIVQVSHAYMSEGWGPEHSCGFLAFLDDGNWLAVEESEDTSGHGCQWRWARESLVSVL